MEADTGTGMRAEDVGALVASGNPRVYQREEQRLAGLECYGRSERPPADRGVGDAIHAPAKPAAAADGNF